MTNVAKILPIENIYECSWGSVLDGWWHRIKVECQYVALVSVNLRVIFVARNISLYSLKENFMRLTPTPPEVLESLMAHPSSNWCWRKMLLRDHECEGRLTWEHAMLHAGKRVNEVWAIIRICAKAHSVDQFQDCGILNKEINHWIAMNRIKNWDGVERKYPRTSWRREFQYLNGLYVPLIPFAELS